MSWFNRFRTGPFKEQLKRLFACSESVAWVGAMSLEEAWARCERQDWMVWLARNTLTTDQWHATHHRAVYQRLIERRGQRDTDTRRWASVHERWLEVGRWLSDGIVPPIAPDWTVTTSGLLDQLEFMVQYAHGQQPGGTPTLWPDWELSLEAYSVRKVIDLDHIRQGLVRLEARRATATAESVVPAPAPEVTRAE